VKGFLFFFRRRGRAVMESQPLPIPALPAVATACSPTISLIEPVLVNRQHRGTSSVLVRE